MYGSLVLDVGREMRQRFALTEQQLSDAAIGGALAAATLSPAEVELADTVVDTFANGDLFRKARACVDAGEKLRLASQVPCEAYAAMAPFLPTRVDTAIDLTLLQSAVAYAERAAAGAEDTAYGIVHMQRRPMFALNEAQIKSLDELVLASASLTDAAAEFSAGVLESSGTQDYVGMLNRIGDTLTRTQRAFALIDTRSTEEKLLAAIGAGKLTGRRVRRERLMRLDSGASCAFAQFVHSKVLMVPPVTVQSIDTAFALVARIALFVVSLTHNSVVPMVRTVTGTLTRIVLQLGRGDGPRPLGLPSAPSDAAADVPTTMASSIGNAVASSVASALNQTVAAITSRNYTVFGFDVEAAAAAANSSVPVAALQANFTTHVLTTVSEQSVPFDDFAVYDTIQGVALLFIGVAVYYAYGRTAARYPTGAEVEPLSAEMRALLQGNEPVFYANSPELPRRLPGRLPGRRAPRLPGTRTPTSPPAQLPPPPLLVAPEPALPPPPVLQAPLVDIPVSPASRIPRNRLPGTRLPPPLVGTYSSTPQDRSRTRQDGAARRIRTVTPEGLRNPDNAN